MAKKPDSLLKKLDKAMRSKKFEKRSEEAYKWLKKEASKMYGSKTAKRVMDEQKAEGRQIKGDPKKINIGDMLFYVYDAKHKDTLPYWDSHPLIFLISVEKDRFQGINLHYVPPRYRAQIFDSLMEITNNDRFDKTTKLRLSYQLLKSVTGLKLLKHCYREYLFSHVKSQPVKIQPSAWEIAMFLPMANWQKSTASVIWSDITQKSQ